VHPIEKFPKFKNDRKMAPRAVPLRDYAGAFLFAEAAYDGAYAERHESAD
jgi:hypothetical protein